MRIAVGITKQEATKMQWPDAATDKGVSIDVQRKMRNEWAAAFADPTWAVCWC